MIETDDTRCPPADSFALRALCCSAANILADGKASIKQGSALGAGLASMKAQFETAKV